MEAAIYNLAEAAEGAVEILFLQAHGLQLKRAVCALFVCLTICPEAETAAAFSVKEAWHSDSAEIRRVCPCERMGTYEK